MRWLIGCLMLVVIALVVVLASPLVISRGRSSRSLQALRPAGHYINMEGAAESAFTHAAEWYGLPAPDRYLWGEDEGARCPAHVPARKGQAFWCQALLEGLLVPVEMELISSLGFFRVVRVGPNHTLEAQQQEQARVEYQEKCEYEFPAKGRGYRSCMYY